MAQGKLFNLAGMSTATTGTGTITLGAAVSGFKTFAAAGVADGDTVSYGIVDGGNSETGTGVYTAAGTTLTRSVTSSTNSDAAIVLSGSAQVFVTPRAEDLVTTVKIQKFTASGTYTPSPGMLHCIIECQGPGGGGGGSANSSGATAGGSGGGGGYSRKVASAAAVGASQTVTIGAAGAGAAAGANAGSAGSGPTSVGTLCVANAGQGGGAGSGAGAAGVGATAGTGDIAIPGQPGAPGYNSTTLTLVLGPQSGANSHFGAGGIGSNTSGNGANASGFGAGGAAGSSLNGSGTAAGGNGTGGLVVITEYCTK